jgi:hypothetical protein
MSASPTSELESDFVCDCEEWVRSACAGEPFYREHEGKRYCVLHYPGNEKSADFQAALQRKLANEDFDFCGVWFPDELSFNGFEFSVEANFRFATFSARADFNYATFKAAVDFSSAIFSAEAEFVSATFSGRAGFCSVAFNADTYFMVATFIANADFTLAKFSARADFRFATFNDETLFESATFSDYVTFSGSDIQVFPAISSLSLQFARIEKPDHVSFHTLDLHPHWFINIDARKFGFTNVSWRGLNINEEIGGLEKNHVSSPHRLLAIACRHLAVNAEENHRYEEASKFRYMAMEARRLESWRGFAPWRLSWWYWLASGYGERVWRAFFVLLGILLLSALLYNHVGFARWEPKLASESDIAVAKRDEVGAPLRFSRALTYSAAVMTFQKPEPRPATTAAQTVVLLETILGPVQAALLALAIRRKFMR